MLEMSTKMNLEISVSVDSPADEELIKEGIQKYSHMSHYPTVSNALLEKDPENTSNEENNNDDKGERNQ